MKLRVVALVVLVVCAFALTSIAVEFFSNRVNQSKVETREFHSDVQTGHKISFELLGEEIDTPSVPR